MQLIGFILLLSIGLSNTLLYVSITEKFSEMTANLPFLDWPQSVKSNLLLTIKCDAYLKYLNANPFGMDSALITTYRANTLIEMIANY